jgi:hypothetical protein
MHGPLHDVCATPAEREAVLTANHFPHFLQYRLNIGRELRDLIIDVFRLFHICHP